MNGFTFPYPYQLVFSFAASSICGQILYPETQMKAIHWKSQALCDMLNGPSKWFVRKSHRPIGYESEEFFPLFLSPRIFKDSNFSIFLEKYFLINSEACRASPLHLFWWSVILTVHSLECFSSLWSAVENMAKTKDGFQAEMMGSFTTFLRGRWLLYRTEGSFGDQRAYLFPLNVSLHENDKCELTHLLRY